MSSGQRFPRASGAPTPLVVASELSRHFTTGRETLEVLTGLDLKVSHGQTVAITGESGSGKSTLLGLIGGLDRPTGGTLFVGGIDIAGLHETELSAYRNRSVGFIFQFHFLLKDFTALENVMIPGMMGSGPQRLLRERARQLLAEVGLGGRADAWPLELSGGERQRVAVARSLINEPPLILADEPTGNLDERNARSVEEMLFGLVEKHRRTMILVTHDTALSRRAGQHFQLAAGKLVQT
jgi:lipoprotein-releasing system ATP-binding protein